MKKAARILKKTAVENSRWMNEWYTLYKNIIWSERKKKKELKCDQYISIKKFVTTDNWWWQYGD